MQKPDAVADVFQFPQIMRSNNRCEIPVEHLRCEQAFYCLAHNRIQTIERLVTEQVSGSGTEAEEDGNLFFSYPWKKNGFFCLYQLKNFFVRLLKSLSLNVG